MKLLDKTKDMSQEQKFIAYLQNESNFADLVQFSYEKRTVVFGKNDISITEINVKRKMLRELLTLFIKFKNFNSLHIEIYARDNMGYPKIYRAFAERKVFF